MRGEPQKLARVVYDTAWMQDNRLLFLGPLLIFPAMFNTVYANRTSWYPGGAIK